MSLHCAFCGAGTPSRNLLCQHLRSSHWARLGLTPPPADTPLPHSFHPHSSHPPHDAAALVNDVYGPLLRSLPHVLFWDVANVPLLADAWHTADPHGERLLANRCFVVAFVEPGAPWASKSISRRRGGEAPVTALRTHRWVRSLHDHGRLCVHHCPGTDEAADVAMADVAARLECWLQHSDTADEATIHYIGNDRRLARLLAASIWTRARRAEEDGCDLWASPLRFQAWHNFKHSSVRWSADLERLLSTISPS